MGNHSSKTSQIQIQSQNQLQDLALSFDNMKKLVSTLEQMAIKVQGIQKQKQFKSHDFYNYSWKDLEALKQQATVQMYSFATSKYIFDSQHGKEFYRFPKSFSKKEFQSNLNNYSKIFKKAEINECCEMIDDLKNILQSNYQTYYEKTQKMLAEAKQHKYQSSGASGVLNFIQNLVKSEKHTQHVKSLIDPNEWQEVGKIQKQDIESEKKKNQEIEKQKNQAARSVVERKSNQSTQKHE